MPNNRPPLLGATGAFRGATECGSGPTKGSESPFTTGFRVRGEAVIDTQAYLRVWVVSVFQRPHQREKNQTCLSSSERQRFSRRSLKERG